MRKWEKNSNRRNGFSLSFLVRAYFYVHLIGSEQLAIRSEYTHPCHNCSFINLLLPLILAFQFTFFLHSASSMVCSESKNYKNGIFHRTGDWYGCCGQTTKATINNTRCRGTRSTLSITLRRPENRFLSTRNRLHAVLFMRPKWHIYRIGVPERTGIRCRFFGAYATHRHILCFCFQ